MFNVRLAGDHLYGLASLVMSSMVSYFVLSVFPRDVLDESGTELGQFLRIFLPTLVSTSSGKPKTMFKKTISVCKNMTLTDCIGILPFIYMHIY